MCEINRALYGGNSSQWHVQDKLSKDKRPQNKFQGKKKLLLIYLPEEIGTVEKFFNFW